MMNEPLSHRIHSNFHLSMTTLTGTRTGNIIHIEEIPQWVR